VTKKRWSYVVLALLSLAVVLLGIRFVKSRDHWFAIYPMPLKDSERLFDMGVVDANADGRLDIYTSNHHFRQALLVADGKGGYRDVVSAWGLDQSREFPLAELSFIAPRMDKPGLYIYWLGTDFYIRTHGLGGIGPWKGSLHDPDPIKIMKDEGFRLVKKTETLGGATGTVVEFAPKTDGLLVLRPDGQGLRITFNLEGAIQPDQVYVGRGKISPGSTTFGLAMQDRHALAWADYNDDGVPDIFIDRPARSGACLTR
jgi:hypothetical protein